MPNTQELYTTTICHLPPAERLRLVALIADGLAQESNLMPARQSALDVLEVQTGGRLFQTSAVGDEYLRQERESWDR